MSRCLTSFALLFAAILLAGCTEESLDLPIIVPETWEPHSDQVEVSPEPIMVQDWIGEPRPGFEFEEDVVEAEKHSAVDSIWNALLEGTSQAFEDGVPQP